MSTMEEADAVLQGGGWWFGAFWVWLTGFQPLRPHHFTHRLTLDITQWIQILN